MPALTMSWIQHLVSDDPATASRALPALPARDALIRWRIVDTNALCGRVQVAVYRGEPEHGWALLEEVLVIADALADVSRHHHPHAHVDEPGRVCAVAGGVRRDLRDGSGVAAAHR